MTNEGINIASLRLGNAARYFAMAGAARPSGDNTISHWADAGMESLRGAAMALGLTLIDNATLTATADAGYMHPRDYIKAIGADDRLMTDAAGNIVGPR